MPTDNTDDPISSEYEQAGRRQRDAVQTDPRKVKPGRWTNQGKRIHTDPGPGSPAQPGPSGPPQPAVRYATTFKPKADRNKNKDGGVQ